MPEATDELFPFSARVIYAKAPLVQVIAQVRFPPILKIEGHPPAEFQDRIRRIFPLLEKHTNPFAMQLSQFGQLPPEVVQALGQQLSGIAYIFLTEDRATNVNLAPDSLTVTTNAYRTWEDFRDQMRRPLQALVEVYEPTFFSRIGLRYVDAINRANIGMADRPWSELLNKPILGELALAHFERNIDNVTKFVRIKLPDSSGSLQLRHGFAIVQGQSEVAYSLDFDFSREQRTEVADAESVFDRFNRLAGRAFRWCITDALHDALEPADLPARPPRAS